MIESRVDSVDPGIVVENADQVVTIKVDNKHKMRIKIKNGIKKYNYQKSLQK